MSGRRLLVAHANRESRCTFLAPLSTSLLIPSADESACVSCLGGNSVECTKQEKEKGVESLQRSTKTSVVVSVSSDATKCTSLTAVQLKNFYSTRIIFMPL